MRVLSICIAMGMVLSSVSCGKSKGSAGSAASGAMSAMGGMDGMGGMSGMGGSDMGASVMRIAPMGPAEAVTNGPTGVKECDEALDIICRCAKTQVSLKRPCKTLKSDSARWKTEARNQDPQQLKEVRTSCSRILKSIQAAYGCK